MRTGLAFSHQTSLQLAEQALGHRGFLSGEIGRVLAGRRPIDGKPVIFSPFGMAVLDLAVGQWVMKQGWSTEPAFTSTRSGLQGRPPRVRPGLPAPQAGPLR